LRKCFVFERHCGMKNPNTSGINTIYKNINLEKEKAGVSLKEGYD